MTVTASHRRPSSQRWSIKSMGQVATTIMVAHTTALRNGRRIQTEAAIKANRNTTASVSRVSSNCRSAKAASNSKSHSSAVDARNEIECSCSGPHPPVQRIRLGR